MHIYLSPSMGNLSPTDHHIPMVMTLHYNESPFTHPPSLPKLVIYPPTSIVDMKIHKSSITHTANENPRYIVGIFKTTRICQQYVAKWLIQHQKLANSTEVVLK